jgi:hypothetical protein
MAAGSRPLGPTAWRVCAQPPWRVIAQQTPGELLANARPWIESADRQLIAAQLVVTSKIGNGPSQPLDVLLADVSPLLMTARAAALPCPQLSE